MGNLVPLMDPRVILKFRQEKHVQRGYPWVFSNQIHQVEGQPARGEVVALMDGHGVSYGYGLYHDDSQIAVRLLFDSEFPQLDTSAYWQEKMMAANAMRQSFYRDATHARMVYSESDRLPGTIIDRYQQVLTWTTLCYGIESRKETLFEAMNDLYHPTAIVERNDVWLRGKDGLPEQKGVVSGSLPEQIEIEENGVAFGIDVLNGPKTGFFIDQRMNRELVSRFATGRRVLDVFCADGGFGLQAAAAGAVHVDLVDSSAPALERVRMNASRNGLTEKVNLVQADAMDHMASLQGKSELYDLVILDPPAFAKSRRNVEKALSAYQYININGLQLLSKGGLLATASCSQAVSEKDLLKVIRYAARKVECHLKMIYRGSSPPDHPILDAMPESDYLKFFIFEKM